MRMRGLSVEPRQVLLARRSALTLIELLTVIVIITLLVAMTLPALNAARGYARAVTCRNNLRQIGIGLTARGESTGVYCRGAFHWRFDGCVVERSWVADLVAMEVPVGQLLCTASEAKLSETYEDLLTMQSGDFDTTVDPLGSTGSTAPDGREVINPCRYMLEGSAASPGTLTSDQRAKVIKDQVLDKFYNTNYTASWYLVRTEVNLDNSGNLTARDASTTFDDGVANLNTLTDIGTYTKGPLAQDMLGHLNAPQNLIPLMGCGRATATSLSVDIGPYRAGQALAKSYTRGPRQLDGTAVPYASPRSRNGAGGWWALWARGTLQDYTDFAPVHRGGCNILFLDGSVQSFDDENGDGFLNNGFNAVAPFKDDTVELGPERIVSYYSILDTNMNDFAQQP